MNTTTNIHGNACEEPERRRREHYTGYTNTTKLYDEMVDLSDPDPEITQSLEASGYYAVAEQGGAYESVPVDSFLVFDDGSIYGTDANGEDLAEREDFKGYVFIKEGADELSSEGRAALLKETMMIKED